MHQGWRSVVCGVFVASVVGVGTSPLRAQALTAGSQPPPQPTLPATNPPALLPLADPKLPAAESVPRFIDLAGRSGINQREDVRKLIAAGSSNAEVARELCREISEAQKLDHSRTLIILSVLGEMRHPEGEACLTRFIHQPFPTQGTVVDGEIVEQTALGTLQAKAVDGLAYLRNETGDREVLWAAGAHPSRIVRAEAINAYLWNHNDSGSARAALLKVVLPNERDFLDRPRHEPGMAASQFNAKLNEYARKHPAPNPVKRAVKKLTPEEAVGDRPPINVERKPESPPPSAATEQK